MDAIKGLARRMTQTVREKVSNAETSSDEKLNEATRKVRAMEKSAVTLSDKILRAAKLIEELGTIFRDVSEEMKLVPDVHPEIQTLVEDTSSFASVITQKVAEHQASLKDQAFDPRGNFIREVAKLRDAEDDRKKKQLEYDFFKQKVLELRRNPPKDFTRIPRNEQLLEQWRVELWKSTESSKALVSSLFSQGQRAIDLSLFTLGQASNSFYGILASGLKHTYGNARLPLYSPAPLLQPEPLPPNPLPPFVYPQQPGMPPAPGQPGYEHHSPPHQGGWAPQQGSPQQQWGSPQQNQGQPAWGQPQQQGSPYAAQNNSWGQQQSPQQQPQQQQQSGWQQQPPQQQPQQQQYSSWTQQQPPSHQQAPPQQHPPQQQQQPSWGQQPAQAPPPQAQGQPPTNASWGSQPSGSWQPSAPQTPPPPSPQSSPQPTSAPPSHVTHDVSQTQNPPTE